MSKTYTVAVVGIGMVGKEMLKVLAQRDFPASEIRVLATRARTEEVAGREYQVIPTTEEAFEGVDIALFAGTEGAKGASMLFGWKAVEKGALVVDNGGDFRMDPRVPLVVPEVNPEAIGQSQGFIANPNCSTIQMVVALKPLHDEAGLKRIVVSTYQAVSGTGRSAVVELENGTRAWAEGKEFTPEVYPHPIPFNCLPHIGGLKDDMPGYTSEEAKMLFETRKIMGLPDLKVSATCVRVPVQNGHSETVNMEFERPISAERARELLSNAPGIVVQDDFENAVYPLPAEASGTDPVFVGRIREDKSVENGLDIWVVADNIRKGASLNTVQIAEKAIEMGVV
jgi:aspartate-semialdehyde dehydrogenase